MKQIFRDRKHAGRLLATHLKSISDADRKNCLILALPRGGVPVAVEVAHTLNLPMDVLVVRKIGHPYQPEYGIGAITEEGFFWTDESAMSISGVQFSQIETIIEKERKEIDRRIQKYRNNRSLPPLKGKTVILVDDGLATGVTARVAAQYVRSKGAEKIILAVPICPDSSAHALPTEIDELVCFHQSPSLLAVGQFYYDFEQVTDKEVTDLLKNAKPKQKETFI